LGGPELKKFGMETAMLRISKEFIIHQAVKKIHPAVQVMAKIFLEILLI
jgi:hypothetical protein